MTADRLYLDISAVRIQSYLSRTPKLKGRRGASAALAEATRLTDRHPALAGRARVNTEAGEADGVVNLVADTGGDPGTDPAAGNIARAVFAHMRERLPGAEFQAVWGTGPTYLDVHHDTIGPRLARGEVLTDLPPANEFPYAVLCRVCHQDPATGKLPALVAADESRDTCADCLMRYSRQTKAEGEAEESDLVRALDLARAADTFVELAGMGAPDTDRNHLAAVFIDGNAFGDFFAELARHGKSLDPTAKSAISRALNAHTRTALKEAARAVRHPDDRETLCVVPHIVGGDDVLVSLPADRAWQFTRRYLAHFGRLVEETRRGIPVRAELPGLSASAGMVFARSAYPFHLVVEAAERRLRAAKGLVRGTEPSVDFTDITADGTKADASSPVRLAALEASAARLSALAALPASLRSSLAGQLRGGGREGELRARTTADRLGHRSVTAPFLPDPPGGQQPVIPLAQALRIVRWWR